MCTFNIQIDEDLIAQIRPSFSSEAEVKHWMQKQMEMLLQQYASQLQTPFANASTDKVYRHESLCGIFSLRHAERDVRC